MVTIINDAKDFGAAIRRARHERGLSQVKVAELSGCSQRFVSELERGKPTAEIGKAFAVARQVGLVLATGQPPSSSHGEAAVQQLVDDMARKMDKRERKRTRLSDYL